MAVNDGGPADLIQRRDTARAEGRIYGIGYAAVIEPSISNMGYITTAMSVEDRAKAGPKNGAVSTATVTVGHWVTSLYMCRQHPKARATRQPSPRWWPKCWA